MGGRLQKKYRIKYTYSSRDDIRGMKRYILDNFKYRELDESFTEKMKAAVNGLKVFPAGYNITGFCYRGYDIYLQDGMNWKYILDRWISEQST